MTGVIGHIPNPTRVEAVDLASAAEHAGARWIGFADAFWWRDIWTLLESVAHATSRIEIGPAMTNAYLRHRFHTASALATLHETAAGRVFCGIAAGGSEVTAAAHIARDDADVRSMVLVELLRDLTAGRPLDAESGRTLDIELPATPVLMAGRGNKMLTAAGSTADRVLLWAIPKSDLGRSVAVIHKASESAGRSPQLIWAPLVRHADVPPASLGHPAVYAALNTAAPIRQAWGLGQPTVESIRAALVAGRLAEAIDLVPEAAIQDLTIDPGDVDAIASRAAALGIDGIAVPGFAADTVGAHVTWAQTVEANLIAS